MRKYLWFPAAVFFLAGAAGAQAGSPSFTADTVQRHPQAGVQQGRIFVSELGTRMEGKDQQGRQVIQITLPKEGIMRVLFPEEGTYMEVQGPKAPAQPMPKPDNPCAMAPPESKCERVGTETLGAVATEQYRLTIKDAKGPVTVWWDPQRKLPLRQENPDGSSVQQTLRGETQYEGRRVEHWVTTMVTPQGQTHTVQRWDDLELKIPVYQQLGEGTTSELHNIRLVSPDPAWYQVPQGYRRVEPQQQQQQQQPQQQQRQWGAQPPPQQPRQQWRGQPQQPQQQWGGQRPAWQR